MAIDREVPKLVIEMSGHVDSSRLSYFNKLELLKAFINEAAKGFN